MIKKNKLIVRNNKVTLVQYERNGKLIARFFDNENDNNNNKNHIDYAE